MQRARGLRRCRRVGGDGRDDDARGRAGPCAQRLDRTHARRTLFLPVKRRRDRLSLGPRPVKHVHLAHAQRRERMHRRAVPPAPITNAASTAPDARPRTAATIPR